METLSKMIALITDVKLLDENQREDYMKTSKLLEAAVEHLPLLEKRVIKMAYYLEADNNDTYESIAAEFNISVDAVYEAHTNALRLLRNPINNQED